MIQWLEFQCFREEHLHTLKQFNENEVDKNTEMLNNIDRVWKLYWHYVNVVTFLKICTGDLLRHSGHKPTALINLTTLMRCVREMQYSPLITAYSEQWCSKLDSAVYSGLFLKVQRRAQGKTCLVFEVYFFIFTLELRVSCMYVAKNLSVNTCSNRHNLILKKLSCKTGS